MYIPEHFQVRDQNDAIAFMRANPFAILISNTEAGPFATHVPLAVHADGERITLRGHVGRANPHWQYLTEQPLCLTIFHGAHAFVSTSNYTIRESVPTWNYAAVHAYGNARVYSTPGELLPMLHALISEFDPPYAGQWASLGEAYRERMLSHIVGFEIAITKLEAKFKLSQNRTRQEQENVLASLSASPDTAASGVAILMHQLGLGTRDKTK